MSKAILIDVHCENSNGLISPVHTGEKDRGRKDGHKVPNLMLKNLQEVFNKRERCVISRETRD
jgi:hypothetical protein